MLRMPKSGRSRKIRFEFTAAADAPALFGNVRVAAGGKDLYKALNDSGRVTAEGVLLTQIQTRIRPESEPVLKKKSPTCSPRTRICDLTVEDIPTTSDRAPRTLCSVPETG